MGIYSQTGGIIEKTNLTSDVVSADKIHGTLFNVYALMSNLISTVAFYGNGTGSMFLSDTAYMMPSMPIPVISPVVPPPTCPRQLRWASWASRPEAASPSARGFAGLIPSPLAAYRSADASI